MAKKGLCDKMLEVGTVSDRLVAIVFVFEEGVERLICGYAPQGGRGLGGKQSF